MTKKIFPCRRLWIFYYKWVVYIISKIQLTNWYQMNLFTSLYISISSLYKYIFSDQYTYKNIILYIVKLSSNVHKLIYKYIIMLKLELGLFTSWG